MKMKVGVLFNCQHQNIANALRGLVPYAQVTTVELGTQPTPQAVEQAAASLRNSDLLVVPLGGAKDGPLANDSLRPAVGQMIALPPIAFTGFHPDVIYVNLPNRRHLDGPMHAYHSRLIVAAYLGFLDRNETVDLFNRLTYQKLGYIDEYGRAAAFLTKMFAEIGVDIAPYLARWRARGCFMHNINHPKPYVTNDLAAIACKLAGVPVDEDDPPYLEMVPDHLENLAQFPVYPEIAENLGLRGHLYFKPTHNQMQSDFRLLSLEDFVAESLSLYRGVPRASLLAADGVDAALRALGLHESATA